MSNRTTANEYHFIQQMSNHEHWVHTVTVKTSQPKQQFALEYFVYIKAITHWYNPNSIQWKQYEIKSIQVSRSNIHCAHYDHHTNLISLQTPVSFILYCWSIYQIHVHCSHRIESNRTHDALFAHTIRLHACWIQYNANSDRRNVFVAVQFYFQFIIIKAWTLSWVHTVRYVNVRRCLPLKTSCMGYKWRNYCCRQKQMK